MGKSTLGKRLAKAINYHFIDLDREVESYFGTTIERLQLRMSMDEFRKKASELLQQLITN